jgi:hypothetical protein
MQDSGRDSKPGCGPKDLTRRRETPLTPTLTLLPPCSVCLEPARTPEARCPGCGAPTRAT